MICPKCRFDQPDDVYCAYCGIDISKYLRQRRRKRHKAYLLTALIGIATLSIATYVVSLHRVEAPEEIAKLSDEANKVQTKDITPPKAQQDRLASRDTPRAQRKRDDRRPSQLPGALTRDRGQERRERADEPLRESLLDEQKAGSPGKRPDKTYTPAEWFERGRALDDESEAEIEYYKKAIQLDPKFAPAYYRLGAIYYRQANYELADEQFSEFLKHASESDKEAYDIYLYYSPSDVERLSERKVAEQAPAEGEEKETPSEAEEAVEERPSETEEAEEETSQEAEEQEEEAKSETEEGQEETPSEGEEEIGEPVSEELGEETSEEALTIVRFLPADGHVVVPVVLNGFLEARVLVDTGAGITVLSKELAQKLHLEEEPGHGITLKTMAMDIQARSATLDSIQVGDLTEKNLRVAIADLHHGEERKFDAVLGMDFMSKYRIHIDNENGRIVLGPGKTSDQ
jgi:clan AA aspartic protease (TIGR02281 family)